MKKTTKKNIEWVDGKSPIPDPAPQRERVVTALEGLLREYRAGRGDVLFRMSGWTDDNGMSTSLEEALSVTLFGHEDRGRLETVACNDEHVICNEGEHAALVAIGSGSAQIGATVVVDAAIAWLKRDRSKMVTWLAKSLPLLRPHPYGYCEDYGLVRMALWKLPVPNCEWWGTIQDAVEESKVKCCADDVIRAMALAWERRDFPGRVLAPRRAA